MWICILRFRGCGSKESVATHAKENTSENVRRRIWKKKDRITPQVNFVE